MNIKDGADRAAILLHLQSRFFVAWWASENGWEFPTTNNPGNISYTGEGLPDKIGIFAGVTEVYANKVCQYENISAGINAFVLLLELPLSSKILTVTADMLRNANGDIRKMCEIVGESNWAASNYQPRDEHGNPLPGSWKGQNIFNTYCCEAMDQLYGASQSTFSTSTIEVSNPVKEVARPTPNGNTYTIVSGDTLTSIGARFRVPVELLVRRNKISNPNLIVIGEEIKIPQRYTIVRGDNLTHIAEKFGTSVNEICLDNHISNPNYIRIGQFVFV